MIVRHLTNDKIPEIINSQEESFLFLLLLYICDGGGGSGSGGGDGSGVYMHVCLHGCHGVHMKGKEQHSGIDNSPSISGAQAGFCNKHFNPLVHLPVSRELF